MAGIHFIGPSPLSYNPPPVAQPVQDGLDHYYSSLDSNSWPGSGTTWSDLVGTNSVDLTLSAGVTTSTVGGNNSFLFNATGDNIVGTMAYTKTYTALTAEAWIYYDGGQITGDDKGLISQFGWLQSVQSNVTYHTIGTSGANDSKPQAYVAWASSNQGHHPANAAISINAWQHTVITIEAGSTNNLTFYNNGAAAGTDSVPCTSFQITNGSSQQIRIGQEQSGGRQFSGNIAVVRFYDKALSAAEVLENYNLGVL